MKEKNEIILFENQGVKLEVNLSEETGEIAQTRYENYLQFLQEVENRKPIYSKKEGKRK